MARFSPPFLPPENPSPGEQLLFNRFRRDPTTEGWVVFHSLGVTRHRSRISGEIDFIVVIPGEGILCLEVKAGMVARRGGKWIFGTGSTRRISLVRPFRQCSDGMHALRRFISRSNRDLGRLLFFSGVIFTDIDEEPVEWHSWQYVGRTELEESSISGCCKKILARAHQHVSSKPSSGWYHHAQSRPGPSQVQALIDLLRPDFEYPVIQRAVADSAEKEITRFTKEQFSCLDVLDLNPRVLFLGPAGTGKAFLAIEAARRSTRAGADTLLACFNRLLGQWLQCTLSPASMASPCIQVGTFHSLLLRLSGLAVKAAEGSDFWRKRLPDAVIDRVLSGVVSAPLFSFLCIDEAQDLVHPKYLDVLDLLMDGGLAKGRWAMFGDFENQTFYEEIEGKSGDVIANARALLPEHFAVPLRTNCRNTLQIAAGIEFASGLNPGYANVLHATDGPDINVGFVRSESERIDALESALLKLVANYGPEETVVLSTRDDESSTAAALASRGSRVILAPLREARAIKGKVGYSTIHTFKGLEATAVVVTDIVNLGSIETRRLLYVGMSRARVHLSLQLNESTRREWLRIVEQGISATAQGRST